MVKVNGLGEEGTPEKRPDNSECLYEPNMGEDTGGDRGFPSSERCEKRRLRREEDRDREGVDVPDDGPLSKASVSRPLRGVNRRESKLISRARGLGSAKA